MPLKNLQDFRNYYPQYNDVDDDTLARKIHDKWYREIPYVDFAKRIGVEVDLPPAKQAHVDSRAGLLNIDDQVYPSHSMGGPADQRSIDSPFFVDPTAQPPTAQPPPDVPNQLRPAHLMAEGLMPSHEPETGRRINTITGQPEPTFDEKIALLQAGQTMASHMGRMTLGGIGALGATVLGKPEEGAKIVENFMAGAFQAPSEHAAKAVNALANTIFYPITKAAELGPQAGAILEEPIEVAPGRYIDFGADVASTVDTIIQSFPFLMRYYYRAGVKPALNKVAKSSWWRERTIKERGLVLQDLETTLKKNPDMSLGEILRKYEGYQAEAAMERGFGSAQKASLAPQKDPAGVGRRMAAADMEPRGPRTAPQRTTTTEIPEGFTPWETRVTARALRKGDELIINGERYEVGGWKDGKLRLEDGIDIEIDPTQSLAPEAVKMAPRPDFRYMTTREGKVPYEQPQAPAIDIPQTVTTAERIAGGTFEETLTPQQIRGLKQFYAENARFPAGLNLAALSPDLVSEIRGGPRSAPSRTTKSGQAPINPDKPLTPEEIYQLEIYERRKGEPTGPAEAEIFDQAAQEYVSRETQGVEKTGDPLTTKQQREYLLDKIDDALKDKKAGKLKEGQGVTIKIPDDGTFTISVENLETFKTTAAKRFPKTDTIAKPKWPGKSIASKKPTPKRLQGFEGFYYNPFQQRKGQVVHREVGKKGKQGYFDKKAKIYSDGAYVIRLDKPKKFKKPVETKEVPNMKVYFTTMNKNIKPATIEGEWFYGTDAETPAIPNVHVKSEYGNQTYNPEYFDHILTEHPDAKLFMNKETEAAVFKKGKRVVGIVMPVDKTSIDLAKMPPKIQKAYGFEAKKKAPAKEPETVEAYEEMAEGVIKRATKAIPSKAAKKIPIGKQRRKLLKALVKRFNVPIRVGKMRRPWQKTPLGVYKRPAQVIRTQKANDIPVIMHEIGHHIQSLLGLSGKMPPEIQAMSYTPNPAKVDREGFAEFLRYWVTDPGKVKREAPEFTAKFEEALAQDTTVQDIFVNARQYWKEWQMSPSVDKIHSYVVKGGKRRRRMSMNQLYTLVIDELNPLRMVTEAAERSRTIPLKMYDNPYYLAWLNRGWARKANQYIRYGTFQLNKDDGVHFTGKSLREILKPVEKAGEMDMLDTYLIAKRALSDKRIIAGFQGQLSRADFNQAVSELEPKFKKIAEELYEYSDQLLTYLTKSGRLSGRQASMIRSNNLFYAPLYRVMGDEVGSAAGLSRQKFANVPNPIKRLKGSARDIYSPTESFLYNTYAMINAAERNRVGRALLKLTDVEGMGQYIERIPFPVKPEKINKDDYINLLAQFGKEHIKTDIRKFENDLSKNISSMAKEDTPGGKIEGVVKEALKQRGWSEGEAAQIIERVKGASPKKRQDVIEKVVEKTTIMTVTKELDLTGMPEVMIHAFRPNYKAGTNEAIFYENGKPVLVEMSPDLHRAVSALDAETVSTFFRIMSYPAKWLRAGATLSPEFMVRNPARDQWTAYVYSKYNYIPGVDLIRGVYHILGKTDLWQKFNASGAAHAALVSMDRKYLSKSLEQALAGRKVKNLIKNPLASLQMLSELTEEATRIGEFRKALRKEGEDLEGLLKAGIAARDVTLDFSRIGAKTRGFNAIIAFWNAQIQGVDKMRRAFQDHPYKSTAKSVMGITVPSLLLYYAQHDDPYYQELPEWRRIFFWNIITHNEDGTLKNIWSIPKPFELGILFGSMPEQALEWMRENDPEGFKGAMRSLGEALMPGAVPTAVLPIAEWWANKSFFFDSPLVPRGREGLEPQLQYTPRTTETVKLVADQMAKVPVLKEFANPAKIQNIIRGYTGGLGKLALEQTDEILEILDVSDAPPPVERNIIQRIPGLRGFHQRYPIATTKTVERFYRSADKNRRAWDSMVERAGLRGFGLDKGLIAIGLQIKEMQNEAKQKQAAKLFSRILHDEKAMKAMRMLHKKIRYTQANKKMQPPQKRQEINRAYNRIIDIARVAMGKVPMQQAIQR